MEWRTPYSHCISTHCRWQRRDHSCHCNPSQISPKAWSYAQYCPLWPIKRLPIDTSCVNVATCSVLFFVCQRLCQLEHHTICLDNNIVFAPLEWQCPFPIVSPAATIALLAVTWTQVLSWLWRNCTRGLSGSPCFFLRKYVPRRILTVTSGPALVALSFNGMNPIRIAFWTIFIIASIIIIVLCLLISAVVLVSTAIVVAFGMVFVILVVIVERFLCPNCTQFGHKSTCSLNKNLNGASNRLWFFHTPKWILNRISLIFHYTSKQ